MNTNSLRSVGRNISNMSLDIENNNSKNSEMFQVSLINIY